MRGVAMGVGGSKSIVLQTHPAISTSADAAILIHGWFLKKKRKLSFNKFFECDRS